MALTRTLADLQDDATLVKRTAAGDSDAFGALYLRHRPSVLRFVRSRLQNQADAEDVTNEVFIGALGSIRTYRPDRASFVNWLIGIARRTMAARWRWLERHPEVELPPECDRALAAQAPGPEETACLQLELAEHLSRLTPRTRHVMVLRHAAGLSCTEVARTAGMSRGMVGYHTGRARAILTGRPNWAAPAGRRAALPPAPCACGCGVELPADRSISRRFATNACRDRARREARLALDRRILAGPVMADPAVDRVLAAILAAGPEGIARRALGRRLRLPAARLDRIVVLLSARGLIGQRRESVAQKPATRYHALREPAMGRAA